MYVYFVFAKYMYTSVMLVVTSEMITEQSPSEQTPPKFRITAPVGNQLVTDGFPARRANDMESVSMAWIHQLSVDLSRQSSQNYKAFLPVLYRPRHRGVLDQHVWEHA